MLNDINNINDLRFHDKSTLNEKKIFHYIIYQNHDKSTLNKKKSIIKRYT